MSNAGKEALTGPELPCIYTVKIIVTHLSEQ